jgi:hypothetical protein
LFLLVASIVNRHAAIAAIALRPSTHSTMNDDTALMPPPPPRRLKRHKTLPPLNIERSALALVVPPQPQEPQQQSASESMHRDAAMISLAPRLDNKTGGGDVAASSMLVEEDTSEINTNTNNNGGNLGYSMTNDVRPGAVSPEECASVEFGASASASANCHKQFVPEASNNAKLHIESSTLYSDDIQDTGNAILSYDHCSAENKSSSTVPFESDGKSKIHHNKVSDIDSNRGKYQHGSMKRRQSQICDSPTTLVNVSFRDIIGHGQAKLRLDEALLPLALPSDLADSVLTGASIPKTIILID